MRRTANQDARDDRRIAKLEGDILELKRQIASIEKTNTTSTFPRDLRFGYTSPTFTTGNPQGTYPVPAGGVNNPNAYPVRFFDASFSATSLDANWRVSFDPMGGVGDRLSMVTACDMFGGWIPPGYPVILMQARPPRANVAGSTADGLWFIAKGQITEFLGIFDTTSTNNVTLLYEQRVSWTPPIAPFVTAERSDLVGDIVGENLFPNDGDRVLVQWFGDPFGTYTPPVYDWRMTQVFRDRIN